jgi:hypothetical protein
VLCLRDGPTALLETEREGRSYCLDDEEGRGSARCELGESSSRGQMGAWMLWLLVGQQVSCFIDGVLAPLAGV